MGKKIKALIIGGVLLVVLISIGAAPFCSIQNGEEPLFQQLLHKRHQCSGEERQQYYKCHH